MDLNNIKELNVNIVKVFFILLENEKLYEI